tara:strand:+ start:182 stop:421 length:240 start_codon:yes stop_codon:yes gene_type:complete
VSTIFPYALHRQYNSSINKAKVNLMFNDKLQPIYDGRVLVNQSAMNDPAVQAALAEMSKRNFEPQEINRYGIWYISDRH